MSDWKLERIARALADVVVARDAGLCMVGPREALLRALLDEGVLTDDCINGRGDDRPHVRSAHSGCGGRDLVGLVGAMSDWQTKPDGPGWWWRWWLTPGQDPPVGDDVATGWLWTRADPPELPDLFALWQAAEARAHAAEAKLADMAFPTSSGNIYDDQAAFALACLNFEREACRALNLCPRCEGTGSVVEPGTGQASSCPVCAGNGRPLPFSEGPSDSAG